MTISYSLASSSHNCNLRLLDPREIKRVVAIASSMLSLEDNRDPTKRLLPVLPITLRRAFWGLSFLFVCRGVRPARAATASSLTQYGITWTFDKAYTYGSYATGDYWVVGPS